MGWRSFLGGYDAAARGEAVAITFDQSLNSFEHLAGPAKLANAAMMTYERELGPPKYSHPKMGLSVEIAPFAFLTLIDCMMALCEYVIYREKSRKANISLLKSLVVKGFDGLSSDKSEYFDTSRFRIFLVMSEGDRDCSNLPWTVFLNEGLLGKFYDAAQESMDRLKPRLERKWKERGLDF